MSDVTIVDLVALGAAPATNDLLVLVDVSDSTQSAQGSTKKMTVANLFTSPTMTGTVAVAALTASGLITGNAGLTIASGTSALSVVTASLLTITNNSRGFLVNNTAAAGANDLVEIQRGSSTICLISSDASDNVLIRRGAGSTAITITQASGLVTLASGLTVTTGDVTNTAGDYIVSTAGKGLQVKSGSNCMLFTGTLVGGVIAISNSAITTSHKAFAIATTLGGVQGILSTACTAGVCTVTSSSATDTATVTVFAIKGI